MTTRLFKNKYPISIDAEYVIDYVYDNIEGSNFYHQLIRLKDGAILYANEKLNNVKDWCWANGIPYNKTSII